jgi:lipoprotein signal peptidase
LLLILSGAIANGAERVFRGCITDFIKIPLINFPYFNIADVLLFVGCVIFIFNSVGSAKKSPLNKL